MSSGSPSAAGSSAAQPPSIHREVLDSPSRHVQLALVHVPGPSHGIEPQPYLRLSLNIGPSYVIDATGPGGRQLFQCRRHSLLVIPPDTSVEHHAGLPKPAGRAYVPVQLATFRISRELLADCAISLALPERQARLEHQVIAPDEMLRGLALALLSDLRAGAPDGAAATEAVARALVCRVLLRQQRSGPAATADAIARVQAHIESELNAPLALEDLAGVAGMSVFHFCRVFREKLGATPHQYILAQRMARAKRLLWQREAGASIVEVALACGFGSSSHFAAQFKRATGQTPLQWRRSAASPD
jgi:AraC-like DNA-binding protein